MDYIENLFHFYETSVSFQVHLDKGLINPDAICFIAETSQIYVQGTFIGICKLRFEKLEQMILEHDARMKNILGTEGPSVNDGIVNNFTDLVNFLDGFTDDVVLKDYIEAIKNGLQRQLDAVQKEVKDRIKVIEDIVANDSETLNNSLTLFRSQLESYNTRLNSHDTSISALNTSINAHIREYNVLKSNYESFKSYTETKQIATDSSISSINNSISSLQEQFTGLDEKFDSVEDELSEAKSLLEEAERLVQLLSDRFDNTLVQLEQFKKDVKEEIKDVNDSKGSPYGIAPLDSQAKVPSEYLPSYVDDVVEYASKTLFPSTGENGKIYVATDTNLTYRWSGSSYVEISPSLALGETSSTAYAGDKGKAITDRVNSHIIDYSNPHRVTKSQIGLENVDNTRDIDKPISTAVQQALDNKVQIEPGKGLVSTTEIERLTQTNLKMDDLKESLQSEITRATSAEQTLSNSLATHKSDTSNPHGVTKTQVGLSNVDNTSDLDKPVSTAVQTALDTKVNKEEGKMLMTSTQVSKLEGIAEGATADEELTEDEIDAILTV